MSDGDQDRDRLAEAIREASMEADERLGQLMNEMIDDAGPGRNTLVMHSLMVAMLWRVVAIGKNYSRQDFMDLVVRIWDSMPDM